MTSAVPSSTGVGYTPSDVAALLQSLLLLPSRKIQPVLTFCKNPLNIYYEIQSVFSPKIPQTSLNQFFFQINLIGLNTITRNIEDIANRILFYSDNLSGKPARILERTIENSDDCKFFLDILYKAVKQLRAGIELALAGTKWKITPDNLPAGILTQAINR